MNLKLLMTELLNAKNYTSGGGLKVLKKPAGRQ